MVILNYMGAHTSAQADLAVRRSMDALRRIVQAIRVASRAAERDFGLSGAQLFVLQRLAEAKSASVNELARRTLTHQSSVSVVLQRLVEKKLVQRDTSPADGRQVVLSLTPKGKQLVRKSPQAAQDRLIAAIHKLSPAHRKALACLLELVADDAIEARLAPPLFFEDSHNKQPRKSNGSR
jgi:MarR family transcriptional regulator, lower aerobic nicotinate degradation pathway regulator